MSLFTSVLVGVGLGAATALGLASKNNTGSQAVVTPPTSVDQPLPNFEIDKKYTPGYLNSCNTTAYTKNSSHEMMYVVNPIPESTYGQVFAIDIWGKEGGQWKSFRPLQPEPPFRFLFSDKAFLQKSSTFIDTFQWQPKSGNDLVLNPGFQHTKGSGLTLPADYLSTPDNSTCAINLVQSQLFYLNRADFFWVRDTKVRCMQVRYCIPQVSIAVVADISNPNIDHVWVSCVTRMDVILYKYSDQTQVAYTWTTPSVLKYDIDKSTIIANRNREFNVRNSFYQNPTAWTYAVSPEEYQVNGGLPTAIRPTKINQNVGGTILTNQWNYFVKNVGGNGLNIGSTLGDMVSLQKFDPSTNSQELFVTFAHGVYKQKRLTQIGIAKLLGTETGFFTINPNTKPGIFIQDVVRDVAFISSAAVGDWIMIGVTCNAFEFNTRTKNMIRIFLLKVNDTTVRGRHVNPSFDRDDIPNFEVASYGNSFVVSFTEYSYVTESIRNRIMALQNMDTFYTFFPEYIPGNVLDSIVNNFNLSGATIYPNTFGPLYEGVAQNSRATSYRIMANTHNKSMCSLFNIAPEWTPRTILSSHAKKIIVFNNPFYGVTTPNYKNSDRSSFDISTLNRVDNQNMISQNDVTTSSLYIMTFRDDRKYSITELNSQDVSLGTASAYFNVIPDVDTEKVDSNEIEVILNFINSSGFWAYKANPTAADILDYKTQGIGIGFDTSQLRNDLNVAYGSNASPFGYWAITPNCPFTIALYADGKLVPTTAADNFWVIVGYNDDGTCIINVRFKVNLSGFPDSSNRRYFDPGYSKYFTYNVVLKNNIGQNVETAEGTVLFEPPTPVASITNGGIYKTINPDDNITYVMTRSVSPKTNILDMAVMKGSKNLGGPIYQGAQYQRFDDNLTTTANISLSMKQCLRGEHLRIAYTPKIHQLPGLGPQSTEAVTMVGGHKYRVENVIVRLDGTDQTNNIRTTDGYLYIKESGTPVAIQVNCNIINEEWPNTYAPYLSTPELIYPTISKVYFLVINTLSNPRTRTLTFGRINTTIQFEQLVLGTPATYSNASQAYGILLRTHINSPPSGFDAFSQEITPAINTVGITNQQFTVNVDKAGVYQAYLLIEDEYQQFSSFCVSNIANNYNIPFN